MHREIYEHLEDVLSGTPPDSAEKHLEQCHACREEVISMQAQAALVRRLKPPPEIEPRAGFYARVLERIEAEGPISIWNLFAESIFGKRIAVASLALALVLGIYLVSIERSAEPMVAGKEQTCLAPACNAAGTATAAPGTISAAIPGEDAPGVVLSRLDQEPPNDDMLVNLVTYREQ